VAITPLILSQLRSVFRRSRDPLQSTDFSFTRFLTPYLSGFSGWSVFMDCDMLMRADISELYRLRDERFAVLVVKHDHRPRETTKFLNEPQSAYAKKNWSSVMLFNNSRCRALLPEYVNRASGLELHQFAWLAGDGEIGALPSEWNHLVNVNPPNPAAKLVHYTLGGPYFGAYATCEFAAEWRAAYADMMACADPTPAATRVA
jgi:hypothetical protein